MVLRQSGVAIPDDTSSRDFRLSPQHRCFNVVDLKFGPGGAMYVSDFAADKIDCLSGRSMEPGVYLARVVTGDGVASCRVVRVR